MKLSVVLPLIRAPESLTTAIGGLFDPQGSRPALDPITLEQAEAELAQAKSRRDNAKSDASYWHHNSQVARWSATVDLLQAAAIAGPDNLPNLPPPTASGRAVMDAAYDLEEWGRRLLEAAMEQGQRPESPSEPSEPAPTPQPPTHGPFVDPAPPAPTRGAISAAFDILDAALTDATKRIGRAAAEQALADLALSTDAFVPIRDYLLSEGWREA